MPAEHYRPDGGLYQGYYCSICGAPGVNMVGTGHGIGQCTPNPELVSELRKANAREPSYVTVYPNKEPEMKLGEKLKKTLGELEQAKIKGLEAQAAADMEAVRRARADVEDWLEHVKNDLVSQINLGRVPLKRVTDYNRQIWLREANKGHSSNFDLWSKFRQFWVTEGLEPVIEEAHDGIGMDSWINLTVKVLPARPRTVDTFSAGLKGSLGVGEYRG